MKRTLIIKTTRDEMIAGRDKLVTEFQKDGTLEKWSDYAVENTDKDLFIFKVLPFHLSAIMDELRGYDKVEADELVASLEKTIEEVKEITGKDAETAPDAPESPENSAKVEEDTNPIDDENFQEKRMDSEDNGKENLND